MMSSTTQSRPSRPAVIARAVLAGVFLFAGAAARPAAAAPVEVPQAWLVQYGLSVGAEDNNAANGMKVWECYVAGLDPTNAAARFNINIDTEGGPFLSWTPNLGSDRVYTVEARTNLSDSGWIPLEGDAVPHSLTNAEAAGLRFFRVKAALPEIGGGGEPPDGQSYMVIDLSGGTNAASYPVSYLDAPPEGGWTDEYKTTNLVMRWIGPGTFTMGSPTNELGRYSDETQHEVTLTKPFYIGVFELTQKQWELVMGDNPSYYKGDARPVEQVSYAKIRGKAEGTNWPASAAVDAGSFMGKIRVKTGLDGFDLPTEAQWEYACRAGTTTALNTGKNLSSRSKSPEMNEAGRYGYNCPLDDEEQHTTVGLYLPNAWGLYDMHGNVYEWCLDWKGEYPSGAVTNPVGVASGSRRVRRGGSFRYAGCLCRSANRNDNDPRYAGSIDDGFRPVCSAGPRPPETTE